MKRKSHKSVRLKLRFKAWQDGELVIDTTRHSRGRLRRLIQAQRADKYYIRVAYGMGWTQDGYEEIYNGGVYSSKKELLNAFSIFTSCDEVNDHIDNFSTKVEEGKQ